MTWFDNVFAFARDERFVMLGIGVASASIVHTLVTNLIHVRDSNAIPPTMPKTRYITQDTEDSLEPRTLDKLLKHPSFAIREIATKILCERAVNNKDVVTHLLYGITRPDYDERMASLRALALLTGQQTGFEGLGKLNQQKAYSALVRSLELSLGDSPQFSLNDHYWDEYYLRDMTERFCLMFVLELTNKYGSSHLIRAKFIEKWLAKQLWGDDADERRKNFDDYTNYKDNRIVSIVNNIKQTRRGMRALEKAGLVKIERARHDLPAQEIGELLMTLDERRGSDDRSTQDQHGNTRLIGEQSVEEQRLRRQHREAMVLNDGTRPLGRDDIIEPDHEPGH